MPRKQPLDYWLFWNLSGLKGTSQRVFFIGIELRQVSFNEEILNFLFVESKARLGAPSMAFLLEGRLLICHVDRDVPIVTWEQKIESEDGHVAKMAISECGTYICVASLGGIKVFNMSLQGRAEFVQRIDYKDSISVIAVYVEKINGIYHLAFSEMGGYLRVFRLESSFFVPAWGKKWADAHAVSVLKGLRLTTDSDVEECFNAIVYQLEPTQSMFYSVIDYEGKEISSTAMTRDGAPPTSGLFDGGRMIYYSHLNEQTKSGEIMVAWLGSENKSRVVK